MDDITILELAAQGWDESGSLAGNGNYANLTCYRQVFYHSPNQLPRYFDINQAYLSTTKTENWIDFR